MENTNNNNSALYIVIIVILLAIIGVLTYLIVTKNEEPKENKETNTQEVEKIKEEEEEEKLTELTDSELDDIANKIEVYNKGLARFYPLSDVNSLEDLNLLQFALMTLDDAEAVPSSSLQTVIDEYFNKKVTTLDYICDGETKESECNKEKALYELDKNSNVYNVLEVSRGAYFIGVGDSLVKIVSQEINNDKLVIKAKVVYGSYINSSTNPPLYYASLEDSKNGTNNIYEKGNWNEEISEEKKEELFNKVDETTTYTFKKVDKAFILQSVE